nr:D-inositol-3-phosphate glycosyltransferase [uncultured archaeon]
MMKIIQISSASSSFSAEDYEEDIFRVWSSKVGFELKRFYPSLEIECWAIEKKYKNERKLERNKIKFRIFPTDFSLRHGMEISLFLIKALKKEIDRAKKENKKLIIHIHEYHTWLAYSILKSIKKDKNIKIIAQHHGGRSPFKNLRKYNRFFLIFPLVALMQLCERILLKKIEVFYALSNEEIKYLKEISPQSKIKFQTMGISEEYFKKIGKKTAWKKLGLNLNKKYLLYIGRIKTTKGIKELLDAAKILEKQDIKFLLIGNGTEKEVLEFENYAKDKEINNVKFLGAIYGKEKLYYLSACDCLVLPSYTEGAPVVIMEAMAKNLPVIATDVGGVSIMIKNGKGGVIIKPKSANEIVEAIKEVFTWKRKDIKKNAKKYKWKKIIKDIAEDYLK